MFRFFEKLLPPYPAAEPALPPQGFFAFLWACTHGVRGKIDLNAFNGSEQQWRRWVAGRTLVADAN